MLGAVLELIACWILDRISLVLFHRKLGYIFHIILLLLRLMVTRYPEILQVLLTLAKSKSHNLGRWTSLEREGLETDWHWSRRSPNFDESERQALEIYAGLKQQYANVHRQYDLSGLYANLYTQNIGKQVTA